MKMQIAVCIHTHKGTPIMVVLACYQIQQTLWKRCNAKEAQIGKGQRVAWDVGGSEDRRVLKEGPRGWSVDGQKEITWEAPKGWLRGGEAGRS